MQAIRIPVIGEVPTPILALIGLIVLVVVAILAIAHRHRLGLIEPVILRRGHLFVAAVALVLVSGFAMTVSLIGRHNLNVERDARLQLALDSRVTQAQVDQLVRDLKAFAVRQAELASPSTMELARRSSAALMACAKTSRCRAQFTRVVNRVLRIRDGVIVPAPGSGRTPGARAPSPSGGAGPQGSAGGTGPAGAQGPPGTQGKPGKDARPIDSGLLDGLDNRIHDVETGLGAILGRLTGLDRLVALLCRALPICK